MLSIIIDLYLMRNLRGLGYLFTCLINLLSQCEHHNRSLFNEKSLWSWLPLYLSYQSIITMLSIIIDLYLMRNLRGLGYLFTCLINLLSQCEHHNRSLFNEKSPWSWLPLYLSYQSIITMLSIIIDLYLMRNLRGLGYLFTCLINLLSQC